MNGLPNRQDYLQTALDWISAGQIEEYMSQHQFDANSNELRGYFQNVLAWVVATFPNKRKTPMRLVEWGPLCNKYKDATLGPVALEAKIARLVLDEEVQRQGGYPYVLDGDERWLNLRGFTDNQKQRAFERQGGVCPVCKEKYELHQMEDDHITPWHAGGKTTDANRQPSAAAGARGTARGTGRPATFGRRRPVARCPPAMLVCPFSPWRLRCLLAAVALLLARPAAPALAQRGPGPDAPQGRFLQPAVRVGEPLDYELRYEHAPDLEVVFPDSLAPFAPFEYHGRTFYPTRTRRGRSLDRAVYHLRTFRLDAVQALALPVAVLRGPDTLSVLPAPARVRLVRTAPARPAEAGPPALKQNLALRPVRPLFNYPYWLAGLAVGALLLVGGAALFRQRLTRRYRAYKLRKNHGYFLAQFARHVERFDLSRSATNVERAVALWKNYLSGLDNSALSSFTTREIVVYFENDDDVRRALRTTDQVIYGNVQTEDAKEVDRAFQRLRAFAERRYAALRD